MESALGDPLSGEKTSAPATAGSAGSMATAASAAKRPWGERRPVRKAAAIITTGPPAIRRAGSARGGERGLGLDPPAGRRAGLAPARRRPARRRRAGRLAAGLRARGALL